MKKSKNFWAYFLIILDNNFFSHSTFHVFISPPSALLMKTFKTSQYLYFSLFAHFHALMPSYSRKK
jgi:hypothetical protein